MVETAPIPQFTQIGGSPVSTPRWFASDGYNLRFLTKIEPLICGKVAFEAVAIALKEATKTIHIAIWGLDPGLVMLRNGNGTYAEEDILFNILLERASEGVKIDIVVWNSPGPMLGNLKHLYNISKNIDNIAVKLTSHNSALGASGSFHQKMVIVDVETPKIATAFVMGHNLMAEYWATTALPANSAQRDFKLKIIGGHLRGPKKLISATVVKKKMTKIPYLDVSSQLWGAGVVDVYHAFSTIWRKNGSQEVPSVSSLNAKLQEYNAAPRAGGSTISQVAVTWNPEKIEAIREQYKNAFRATNRYVIMINQYLRDQSLAQEIIDGFRQRIGRGSKDLHIIIITTNFEEDNTLPIETGFEKVVINMFLNAGITVSLGRLVTKLANGRRNIYIHAKVLIVDEAFTTLGSANFNDRSFRSDPELNIGMQDPALTARFRRELMDIIIGNSMDTLQSDPEKGYGDYLKLIDENDKKYSANQNLPHGRVITYTPTKDPYRFISHTKM